MAVTGLIFVGYVLAHMYGNLKVFAGQDSFDEYAHHLREFGEPILPYEGFLWVARVVLILAVIGHAYSAFKLWHRAAVARREKYSARRVAKSTLSSRTMRWGGTALLAFIVFHILHLTTRTITPGSNSDSPYERLVAGFQPERWWLVLIYLVALVALGMHLRHGVWSACQTLGWTNTAASRRRAPVAADAAELDAFRAWLEEKATAEPASFTVSLGPETRVRLWLAGLPRPTRAPEYVDLERLPSRR